MDSRERATVMLLHGSGEDRLRQAIAQGLVSKEVQKDIEDVLAEAEEARVYAESMQRQVEKHKSLVAEMENELSAMQQRENEDARYYAKAVEAFKREEKRRKENADKKETFIIAVLGAGAFLAANILGHLVFGVLFR